jgi:hypothetical protein
MPRPSMAVGEPTAAIPVLDSAPGEAPKAADDTDLAAEGAPDNDGESHVPRRRSVPDSPGAGVAEAVEAGSLASPGGGGDGVALFDQESDPEGGAPITGGRYRRR